MKQILFFLTLILLFSGCSNKGKITITGNLKDNGEKYIFLNRVDVDTPVLIDSARISKKGSFRLKIKSNEADFYQLGFSSSNFITLLTSPDEKIDLKFNSKNLFENYVVKGSTGSKKLQQLDVTLAETKRKLDSISTLYTKASLEPGFDAKKPLLETEFGRLVKLQRKKNIEFIITNVNSLASIKALYQRINPDTYVLYDNHDLQYLKIVTDSLTRHYPNSKQVQALARDFEKEMNQMYSAQIQQLTKSMPKTDLNPDLMDIAGKRVSLSSLKGKYVLLTFWSVKSQSSIEENLQLKDYYKRYNKLGFEIYQIDLDENEAEWKAAVRFDELPWINAREDDPKQPKNAILYNVKTLPANYLYDKSGTIIASNIHGKSLQLKLEQIFNK